MVRKLLIAFLFFVPQFSFASEPLFCDPAKFSDYEIQLNQSGLQRAHAFKIGNLTLVGLAIYPSKDKTIKQLALSHSPEISKKNYCTWYFNIGDLPATFAFTHQPLPKPNYQPSKVTSDYYKKIHSDFELGENSFAQCAAQENYIALGCNSQKHRGPSVFAMILSFAGCSPEHSVAIVNQLWGSNGIPDEDRLALARMAYNMGQTNSEAQQLLLNSMN